MTLFKGSENFVLLVGEYGVILSHFVGKKLEHRLFASSASISDRREFNALLQQHPNIPLSIFLDVMDQTFSQQQLPAVNMFSVDKLVQKRLERDFGESDIKGAILQGREKTGRKDWRYLFVSVTQTESLSAWIEYAVSLPNPLKGIFLLPIEMATFAAALPEDKKTKDTKAEPEETGARWQLITSHHKTSGIRQTVLQDGITVFSRLILPGKENMPEMLAGTIEQETLNSIEYMRRLSFEDNDHLEVTIVASKEIKEHLKEIRIENYTISLLTPHEAALATGFKDVTGTEDKFSDLIFVAHFLNSRPKLKLQTPETKRLNVLLQGYKYSFVLMACIVPAISLYTLYLVYGLYGFSVSIKDNQSQKAQIEARWRGVQESGEYDIDEAKRITDVIGIHKKIVSTQRDFLPVFAKVKAAQRDEATVKSISWSYGYDFTDKKKNRLSSRIDLEFMNVGNNIDALFTNFDAFTRRFKNVFKDFELTHTRLPDKIRLGQERQVVGIQITITDKFNDKRR